MGKPYSLDLRKRVVAAIEGGMSRNQAAKQLGVAISTAIGLEQRVEETGSVSPVRGAATSGAARDGCGYPPPPVLRRHLQRFPSGARAPYSLGTLRTR